MKMSYTGKLDCSGWRCQCALVDKDEETSYMRVVSMEFGFGVITGEFKQYSYTFDLVKLETNFEIIDDLTGSVVKCHVDKSDNESLHKLLLGSHKVKLAGWIHRHHTTGAPLSMYTIEAVEAVETSYLDARGVLAEEVGDE